MTTSINSAKKTATTPLWQNLFGIIDKPTATFESVLENRRWLRWGLPLLLYFVAFAVVTAVQTPYLQEIAREQAAAQLADLPRAQAEAARSTMEFTLSLPFMLASGLLFGSIALAIGVLAQTAYCYFAALISGGEDVSFGDMFSMSAWSRLPLALGFLVQAVIAAVTQGAIRYPGLAMLVASGDQMADARNPLVSLLARLDLFWLWHLLLVTLGLAVAAKFGRGKSLALTVVYALLALGMAVIPSLLALAFAP